MCLAFISALLHPTYVTQFLSAKRYLLAVIVVLSCLILWITNQTAAFWGPLSDYTFVFSVLLLALFSRGDVYADFDAKELGLNEFAVNMAPACSGYEGIGLVCSFIAVYIYINKHEFRFPQAFLLFPLGALTIWLLNVVRIVVLILIGEYGSAEVAVGGFHSQAGWLTFILASLGILWVASAIRFFPRPIAEHGAVAGAGAIPESERSNTNPEQADLAIFGHVWFFTRCLVCRHAGRFVLCRRAVSNRALGLRCVLARPNQCFIVCIRVCEW